MSSFTVTFAPAGAQVTCSDGESVLEAALAAGFFPNHSCRRGQCNSCEAKVLSGEVVYPDGFVPEGVRPDRVLTCMVRPASDVVLDAPEVSATAGQRVVQTGARVVEVRHASADVAIVRLQVPPAAGFDFEPGQYVDVVLRDGARRSYSMANAPASDGIIEWHVRALPGGRFSNHVYDKLKARDMLRIEGPFGTFMLQQTDAPMILLASGTGLAPILSMLRAHGDRIAARGAVLYWGGARAGDLYGLSDLAVALARYPGIGFVPVLSAPEPDWTGRTGFVHQAVAEDFADMSKHEVYACGNPLMVDAARHVFVHDNALPEAHFFSDAFVTVRTPPASAVSGPSDAPVRRGAGLVGETL